MTTTTTASLPLAPLRFLRRGQPVTLHDVPPDRTLLQVLREDLRCHDTKEGCGEGDCGACTVTLAHASTDAQGQPQLQYQAINSCIRLAHSIDGMALWTAQDLVQDPFITHAPSHPLHPAQEAMVQCHASQCGFCTPGFVMSLFALYQNHDRGQGLSRSQAQEALSGNLCRCTGYRAILDAAEHMPSLPPATVNSAQVLSQLLKLQKDKQQVSSISTPANETAYKTSQTLDGLLQLRADHPHAQVVAGCTDVGLWVTKQHKHFDSIIDVTATPALRDIHTADGWLRIGAAATLEAAFAQLQTHWPQLHRFAARFAGLPVRNSGTLGGNVANGSPIGDSMPLLIALGAQVVLASVRGSRSLPLEQLYTGYRQNVMQPDELLVRIDVPLPQHPSGTTTHVRAYKVSKRQDDDISAVCLAIALQEQAGRVTAVRIGAGGVAATPARAVHTEAVLLGQLWDAASADAAAAALQAEFQPISDMRASSDYRRHLLGSLVQRFWRESQGQHAASLEEITVQVQA